MPMSKVEGVERMLQRFSALGGLNGSSWLLQSSLGAAAGASSLPSLCLRGACSLIFHSSIIVWRISSVWKYSATKIDGVYTGENLPPIILDVIVDYGFESNMGFFIMDNASNNDTVMNHPSTRVCIAAIPV